MRTIDITEAKEWKQTLIDVAQTIQDKAAINGNLSEWDNRVYNEVIEIEKKLDEMQDQQAPERSADQILAKWEGHEGLSLNDDRVRTGRMRVIAAMKEYAGQLRSEQRQEISDEEIEKWANELIPIDPYSLNSIKNALILGAKWYREQIKNK